MARPIELTPAGCARRALARPGTAHLLVDGLDTGDHTCEGVELADRGGTPLLACDPGSPLALAGEQRRTATLTVAERGAGRRVLLSGRFAPAGHQRLAGRDVVLVELVLDGVRLAGRDGAPGADVDLDLAAYRSAAPRTGAPSIDEYAGLVRDHTNRAHGGDLLRFVAELTGCAESDLAGAGLAAIDPAGIAVQWVDLDGAHEVRVLFPRQARCCEELADLLRQTLCPD